MRLIKIIVMLLLIPLSIMERLVIRWSLRRLRDRPLERYHYDRLYKYGVADVSRD